MVSENPPNKKKHTGNSSPETGRGTPFTGSEGDTLVLLFAWILQLHLAPYQTFGRGSDLLGQLGMSRIFPFLNEERFRTPESSKSQGTFFFSKNHVSRCHFGALLKFEADKDGPNSIHWQPFLRGDLAPYFF